MSLIFLFGKTEKKTQLGRYGYRWDDDVKWVLGTWDMNFRENFSS